jgi:adenylate cyclase
LRGGPDDMMSGLSDQIATALSVTLGPEEKKRIYLRHTSNLYALELFNYATRQIYPPTPARIEAARNLFNRVMEIDPGFAGGSAGLSEVHSYRVLFEQSVSPEEDLAAAINYAQQAIDLDPDFGMGHAMLGVAYTLMGQHDLGLSYTLRAVGLEPGDPLSHQWLALSLIRSDRPEEAIVPIQEARRLDPLQPQMPYLPILGMAYYLSGQYDSALESFLQDQLSGVKRGPYVSAGPIEMRPVRPRVNPAQHCTVT